MGSGQRGNLRLRLNGCRARLASLSALFTHPPPTVAMSRLEGDISIAPCRAVFQNAPAMPSLYATLMGPAPFFARPRRPAHPRRHIRAAGRSTRPADLPQSQPDNYNTPYPDVPRRSYRTVGDHSGHPRRTRHRNQRDVEEWTAELDNLSFR